ncbi:hypothetical protein ACFYPX_27250 [Micromonospora zamorensis]|uniref:hypothetical protein n=1 Tax=Micromonospora zamorensis TaxID=709883 RepID=UPI0036940380
MRWRVLIGSGEGMMFSVEKRDLIRRRLLHLAAQDTAVVAAAITGSHATDDEDRWSDLERGRYWQAERWISAMRTQTIALACQRLGHPTSYAKGAHLLPADITGPLEQPWSAPLMSPSYAVRSRLPQRP